VFPSASLLLLEFERSKKYPLDEPGTEERDKKEKKVKGVCIKVQIHFENSFVTQEHLSLPSFSLSRELRK